MPKTRGELIAAVLEEILVTGAGETPDADQSGIVDRKIDPVVAVLASTGVFGFSDPGEAGDPTSGDFEEDGFLYLVQILGEFCSPAFGRPFSQATVDAAERQLKRVATVGRSTRKFMRTAPELRGRRRF